MIFLREISKSDIPIINQWRNNKEITDCLGGAFRFVNQERDEDWFDDYLRNKNTQARCAICLQDLKEIIGVVYLTNIDLIHRSAEFSIMIGNINQQNKGIGTQATQMMLKHAFMDLNLHRVYLHVLEENLRAIKAYEKVGFIREGKLREAAYKNGKYKNLIVMAILKKIFIKKKESV